MDSRGVTCSVRVAVFLLFLMCLFTLIFSIANNAWIVVRNGPIVFERGLNDDCVLMDNVRTCTSWSENQRLTEQLPRQSEPMIILRLMHVIKYILLVIVSGCLCACLASGIFLKAFKFFTKVCPPLLRISILIIGVGFYLTVVVFVPLSELSDTVVFHWGDMKPLAVHLGAGYYTFLVSSVTYLFACLLYYTFLYDGRKYDEVQQRNDVENLELR